MLALVCVLTFVHYAGAQMRGPVLPLYAAGHGATPTGVGLIVGAHMALATLGSIPLGRASDHWGRRPLLVGGMLVSAVTSLLLPLAEGVPTLAGIYGLAGLGVAAFSPSALSLVGDLAAPGKAARAYAWYSTAHYGAIAIGPFLGGLAAEWWGHPAAFVASAGIIEAQSMPTRTPPRPDTPRMMVQVFGSADKVAGPLASDELRERLIRAFPSRILWVIDRKDVITVLEQSGYDTLQQLPPSDESQLAKSQRADEYIRGNVVREGDVYKVMAWIVLTRNTGVRSWPRTIRHAGSGSVLSTSMRSRSARKSNVINDGMNSPDMNTIVPMKKTMAPVSCISFWLAAMAIGAMNAVRKMSIVTIHQ